MSGTGYLQGLRNFNYANFANYRRGLHFSNSNRNRNLREFHPLSGDAPVIYIPSGYDVRQIPFQLSRQDKIDIDTLKERDLKGLRNSVVNAYNDLQRLKTYMSSKSDGKLFKYRRCLGWGGNGLAAVFDILDENNNLVRSVVVKTLFDDDDESLDIEKHARSEHIVQLVYVEGEGLIDKDKKQDVDTKDEKQPSSGTRPRSEGDSGGPRSSKKPRSTPSTPPPMTIILELLENGDLSNFIVKVRDHNERIPNKVLWGFLLCLVRMCIGLAYPPDDVHDYIDMPGPITETVIDYLKDDPRRIVHFDMDPRNIFIGNFSDEEHRITPILKLGDFGLAVEVADDKNDAYYEYMRRAGKRAFYAPEQFCADWDYIPRDRNLIQDHPIAGNYHWHTNVWGVGMIMECLVTLCYPLIPPTPTHSAISPPQSKARYWTYGAHVAAEQYDHVDKDIRSIILRCQANFPEDRPRLETLEEFILDRAYRDYAGESDEEVLGWMNKILFEPPSPPATPSSSSASEGPGTTLGTGNPPIPPFFPQGIQLPADVPPPQNPVAPPPRDPEPPTGIFDPEDAAAAAAGGFLGVGVYGNVWGSGASSLVAPNPSPAPDNPRVVSQAQPATVAGPRRRARGGWARRIHPYGRPPGTY
ncbi:kinase-like domain-containing protein [Xylaria longipes]|nr:kinase-like domain-containing protein [Xylaria longipes]